MLTCVLVCVLLAAAAEAVVEYNKSFSGLTSFPRDIPPDTTAVFLEDNSISEILLLDDLPNLVRLQVQRNDLTAFPDLQNISTTLMYLSFAINDISYIEPARLNALTKLKELYLQYNKLSYIPDVPDLYQLRIMTLSGNNFSYFPDLTNLGRNLESLNIRDQDTGFSTLTLEQLNTLPKLEFLNVAFHPLNQWTDICRINSAATLELSLKGTLYTCDSRMVLAKLAEATGHLDLSFQQPYCTSPANLQGKFLDALTLRDLSQQGADDQVFYRRLSDVDGFYCYPAVDSTETGVSLLSCAMRCLTHQQCALFHHDTGTCVVTSLGPGTESQFRSLDPDKWFIIDTN